MKWAGEEREEGRAKRNQEKEHEGKGVPNEMSFVKVVVLWVC
jgi:hypothetical protein